MITTIFDFRQTVLIKYKNTTVKLYENTLYGWLEQREHPMFRALVYILEKYNHFHLN